MTYLPNIDLNYSRPLDVHRWSKHPEVNSLMDKIYSSLPHISGNKTIRKKHLKVLLLDLYVAWCTDPDLKLAINDNVAISMYEIVINVNAHIPVPKQGMVSFVIFYV